MSLKLFLSLCFRGNTQGQDLTKAISRQEVTARLGDQECEVKTLDNTHLYCEPPEVQPLSVDDSNELPSLKVGHVRAAAGRGDARSVISCLFERTLLTKALCPVCLSVCLSGVHGEPAGGPGIGSVRQRLSAVSCPIGCSDRFGGGSSRHHPVGAGRHPHVQVPVCLRLSSDL